MNAGAQTTGDAVFTPLDGPGDDATQRRDHAGSGVEADGIIDVGYRVVDGPVGALLLAGTDRGLVRVAFARGDDGHLDGHEQALNELATKVGPQVRETPERLDPAARQLEEYFAGDRRSFEVPLDLRLSAGFRRRALERIAEIAYGRTRSYGEIAAAAGSPRAVRAVGSACATNPLPILVPCHRVLRADGSPGGYGGGLEAKRILLALEAA